MCPVAEVLRRFYFSLLTFEAAELFAGFPQNIDFFFSTNSQLIKSNKKKIQAN